MERRSPARLVAAALCLALALAAAPAHAADEWVADEANAAHDGLVDASTLTPPLRERWAVDLGYVSSPALVAAGKVFAIAAGSPFATVNAVDATNGVTLWSRPLDGATSAAYDDGRVFVVTAAGDVVAFQADTGVPLWRRATGGGWEGAPTARGGAVYVATHAAGGTLFALSALDGSVRWSKQIDGVPGMTPAVDASRVYIAWGDGRVVAFRPSDGGIAWSHTCGCSGGAGATPVLHAGRVYPGRADPAFPGTALDAATGHAAGTYASRRPPAFDGDASLVVEYESLSAQGPDAATRWSWTAPTNRYDRDLSGPVIANGTAFVGTTDEVWALGESDGAPRWCVSVPAGDASPGGVEEEPRLSAGAGVLVVASGRMLHAFESGGTGGCDQAADTGGAPPASTMAPPPATAPVAPTVRLPARVSLTLRAGRRRLRRGHAAIVRGQLSGEVGSFSYRPVRLQADTAPFDGRWRTVQRATTGKDGRFAFRTRPRRAVRLRAVSGAATSRVVALSVAR